MKSAFGRLPRQTLINCFLLVLVIQGSSIMAPVRAADAVSGISSETLAAALQAANVHTTASNIRVASGGPNVTVLADATQNETDQDLKIDAVFIAKALVESGGGHVQQVKVLYSQPGRDGRYVTIAGQAVSKFGSGQISPEKLLGSLSLQSIHPEAAPKVVAGPEYERRLYAWERIEKLRKQGTGVHPFEELFENAEQAAKASSSELSTRLTSLENKLKAQEDILEDVRKAARGHGVSYVSTSQPSTDRSRTSTSPLPSSIGSGQQMRTGSQPGSGFVPPDADRIREIFKRDAENLIRLVQNRNSGDSQRMRQLKQRIEQCLQSGNKPEAFAMIHDFAVVVQHYTGSDPFGPGGGGNSGEPGFSPPGGGSGAGPGGSGGGSPGQGFPGQGFPGQGFPGQGFPGQGFPGPPPM